MHFSSKWFQVKFTFSFLKIYLFFNSARSQRIRGINHNKTNIQTGGDLGHHLAHRLPYPSRVVRYETHPNKHGVVEIVAIPAGQIPVAGAMLATANLPNHNPIRDGEAAEWEEELGILIHQIHPRGLNLADLPPSNNNNHRKDSHRRTPSPRGAPPNRPHLLPVHGVPDQVNYNLGCFFSLTKNFCNAPLLGYYGYRNFACDRERNLCLFLWREIKILFYRSKSKFPALSHAIQNFAYA